MKKLLVYFIFSVFILGISSFLLAPENQDYDESWRKVEAFVKKGLPKSALKVVDEIYGTAKKEANNPQVLKALIYRVSLQSKFEEEHLINSISTFTKELQTAASPEKQILHSLLAELYQWFYQENRWKINERGTVVGMDLEDIRTWDAVKLNQTIRQHYLASLGQPEQLQKIELKVFSDILKNTDGEAFDLYPTLFDLLGHRALFYFSTPDVGLADISSQVNLEMIELLGPVEAFVKLKPEGDSTSNEYLTVSLYQHLLKLHLDKQDLEALVDLDLRRQLFIYNNMLRSEAVQDAYISTLSGMMDKFQDNKLMVRIAAQLAQQYISRASYYKPLESDDHRYDLNTAEEICEKALKRFPMSDENARCQNLLSQIRQTHFTVKTNTAELPNQPFLAYATFKNITKLHFKAVKLDPDEELYRDLRNDRDGFISSLMENEAYKAWSQDLPDTKDHQKHSAELRMPAFETGYYILFVSTDDGFDDMDQIIFQTIWITELSYVAKNNPGGSLDIHVLHRESGNPLEEVEVVAYEQLYNSRDGGRTLDQIGTFTTDENGFVNLDLLNSMKYSSLMITFRKGNDALHSSDRMSLYKQRISEKVKTKTYFFTDRAIYRPGQTVYFKGIIVDQKAGEVSIKPGAETVVALYNVNRKKVSDLTLVANEFGTFHGSFVIPRGGLNGKMRISDDHGAINILVEEYKRPTFEVVFDTITGEFKIGDQVKVTGKAENYAGNPLIDAQVKYRVVRAPIVMPYNRYYLPPASDCEVEITNGITNTADDGSFNIEFEALSDSRINMHRAFPYRFIVYAEVTDITGEMQSSQTGVRVGKDAFYLLLDTPDVINREQQSGIMVRALNLSGTPIETRAAIELYELKPPARNLSSRRWGQPDINLIPEEQFREEFPHQVFGSEDDRNTWQKTLLVKETLPVDGEASVMPEQLNSLDPGYYKVIATAMTKDGDTISAERIFTLYSTTTKQIPSYTINWSEVSAKTAEPGDVITLMLGSELKKTKIYYEVVNGNEVVTAGWVTVNRGQKKVEIPVIEAYRGNFSIRTFMVKFNRSYINSHVIQVPFTNKKLDIKLETHRDYLTPGQQEEWRVSIKGPDGNALAAELLAGMYDASLDEFQSNSWSLNLYQKKYIKSNFYTGHFTAASFRYLYRRSVDYKSVKQVVYPEINWFGYQRGYFGYAPDTRLMKSAQVDAVMVEENAGQAESEPEPDEMVETEQPEDVTSPPPPPEEEATIPIRSNFNETAFFYPELRTDSAGDVVLVFKTPDALTEWKLMLLATTTDLKVGSLVSEFKARKDLMIIPNLPRFVRQGDQLVFSAKVVNFTEEPLRGQASIEFFDAVTMQKVDIFKEGSAKELTLSIRPSGNQLVSWDLDIPYDLSLLSYRITAQSGDMTDGEERFIPVLTNRMLVTETMPMPLKGGQTSTFTMEKLLVSDKTMAASTRRNFRFTVEFTSNPAWYAVQALPYMNEPERENPGNLFRQYYANALASFIVQSNPKIKSVFESWSSSTPEAFHSNLQKNEELKQVVLQATPWVLEAEDEAEQKRRIALLFDLNRLANQKDNLITKLSKNQLKDGSWPWFKGMRPDRHTTHQVVLGFAKLAQKEVIDLSREQEISKMMKRALAYLDQEIIEDYNKLKKNNAKNMGKDNLGSLQIEYLYMRSMLAKAFSLPDEAEDAFAYYSTQAKKHWLMKSPYLQGMLSMTLYRLGHRNEAEAIIRSLKERALHSDELGMYWREEWSWRWYQAPVETQSMLIEAFALVNKDMRAVEQMKVWLLKQKQTNRWKTGPATAEAVYALLLTGDDLLADDKLVTLKVGDKYVKPEITPDITAEAGTGYFKTSWSGEEITASMGSIAATNPNKGISWGAAYWQYFEDMDKVTASDSPLSIEKQLFVEELTEDGPVMRPLKAGESITTGDKLQIRLIIRADRTMEYVHVRDMRSSALEPAAALSGYQWSGGIGYYRNIKDVGADFFIQYLPKGTFLLEYPLKVSQKGEFSNGIATIQSYYAPEFGAHSAGVRLVVE